MTDETSLPDLPFHPEPLPRDEEEVRARHQSNRAAWNEGALHYRDTLEQAVEGLRSGRSNLHPVERANLGDLSRFETAIHLQCASGRDTLSLWLEGVRHVIGLDISDVHIENARRMAAALNAPAEFYRCDILDTPITLNATADLVYTGRGAINWLQDLESWAKVVYRLLKPGGVMHLLEDHPLSWLFDMDADTFVYSGTSYFGHAESSQGWPSVYIGDTIGIPVEQQSRKYERLWMLADVVNALISAGLVIENLGEHPDRYWDNFSNLKPELQGRIPLTYSILARKPSAP